MAAGLKVLMNDKATKASTVEQSDRTKARVIMATTDRKASLPIASKVDWGTIVCIPAANMEPTIK